MKKIQSLFQRNYETDRLVRNEVVPGSEWVLEGEGVATQKYDGTCCLVKDGRIYKRYDAKKGKTSPPGFIPAQDPDPVTGHHPGWLLCSEDDPADKWHLLAFGSGNYPDGTYELCGERINGNPEKIDGHILIPHGAAILVGCPRDFDGLKRALSEMDIEGVVWHRPNGDMVKIKKKDFGFKR